MSEKCEWGRCPILKLVDEIGIDAFVDGIKEEKRKSANLLRDGSCMVLFVHYHSFGGKCEEWEIENRLICLPSGVENPFSGQGCLELSGQDTMLG